MKRRPASIPAAPMLAHFTRASKTASALDNLVKGAAGAAVQNFNLMQSLPESVGLENPPLFP